MKDEIIEERNTHGELIRKVINIPLDQLGSVDVSNKNLEQLARGYFVGKSAVGRKKDVKRILEERVVNKIGTKGKFLVDKLFELIEGVHVADNIKMVNGKPNHTCYKTPPNLNAIIYALDRVLGKPKTLSVQANFSLSQLLVETKNGTARSNNNQEIPDESPLLYREDVENPSATY